MRKLMLSIAMGVLAVGLVAVPIATAKKGPKPVAATVSVTPTPTTITSATPTVTVTGNVKANSSCRKDRTVRFAYVNTVTGGVTPLAETAVTESNGDYTVILPKPTDAGPATVIVRATLDQVTRKVGSKKKGKKDKKGRRFDCLTATADSAPLTVAEEPTTIR